MNEHRLMLHHPVEMIAASPSVVEAMELHCAVCDGDLMITALSGRDDSPYLLVKVQPCSRCSAESLL